MILLQVRGLSRYFSPGRGLRRSEPVRAVDGVDLDLARGETLGLVGESGCGKTTLGRTLLRLNEPTAGSARYTPREGEAPLELFALSGSRLRRVRRELQMVFQDPSGSLNPRLRAREIVGEGLRAHRLASGAELRDRVVELLGRVGLGAETLERFPHEFSGGERQRIGIARALALSPRLIVCDEALSALDLSVRAQIAGLFADLQAERGLAYLFIAHDLSLVRMLSQRIAVMYLGRIVESAETEELFAAPAHPYTQALLSAAPSVFSGRSPAPLPLVGEPPSVLAPPGGCGFHARCPLVQARCRSEAPALLTLGPTHQVRCHLLEDQSASGTA